MSWNEFITPIVISIKIALPASILVFLLSMAAARWMAKARFTGKNIVETLLLLPLVLPPTVVGFLLLVALGRRSWIGIAYEKLFGGPIVFTLGAAVVAAVVVAFPLAYRTMRAGFEGVDRELEDSARALGASEWQVFRYITAPLAARTLTAGYILGFARGLGEFGATLMIAGNIPGQTQTIATAIYVAVDSGNMQLVWAWAGAMILLSFIMLMLANRFSRE
ncbi:molybdate ABC transporter permease subunit [Paenibacillus spongiae]|uniref:Molybdenum transport system permease n=1 Tax=Paenibacillus spongiae TaxID=2909671 RepID=A0ABY5S8S4_9BACL|nr:molybdate ABC transporter permease subunit [Paenibacillus spongiae]UVI30089.1 molybdate ABC transporter permease subunit [Paenibacillus spongiae]